jgi:hypothetical protein
VISLLQQTRIRTLGLLALTLAVGTVESQEPRPVGTGTQSARSFETRAELEARASAAENQHREGEAWLLRQRLRNGDFQESDRVVVVIQDTPTPNDTFTVRAGKVLQFPRFGDVSLEGVLRSELNERISQHLAQFLKEPSVRATPLVRIGVLGKIGRPGYYNAGADVILSDVLMMAGGPLADADLKKIVIRRGDTIIWNATDTRTALADGLTLDRLHLRAGDEIDIEPRRQISWLSILPVVSSAVALIITLAR